jgi:hypothetical protein
MSTPTASTASQACGVPGSRVLSDLRCEPRSVRSRLTLWQPEGLSPGEARADIATATRERDRLPLRDLWATGARASAVLALRPTDVSRDSSAKYEPLFSWRKCTVGAVALRASKHALAGQAAPVHPHLFRHARVRQTRSLTLARRQAGWSRLQPAYLSTGDEEACNLMCGVTD